MVTYRDFIKSLKVGDKVKTVDQQGMCRNKKVLLIHNSGDYLKLSDELWYIRMQPQQNGQNDKIGTAPNLPDDLFLKIVFDQTSNWNQFCLDIMTTGDSKGGCNG